MKLLQFLIPGIILAATIPMVNAHGHHKRLCAPRMIVHVRHQHAPRACHRSHHKLHPQKNTPSARTPKVMPSTRTCHRAQYLNHNASQRGRCVKFAVAMRNPHHRCCR